MKGSVSVSMQIVLCGASQCSLSSQSCFSIKPVLLRHLNLTRSDGVNNLDTGIGWVINWCLGRKLSEVEIVMGDV